MEVMELMVLMAESASAPARLAARAGMRMSEMLGVSLTITGVRAASLTHSVICWQYSGTCPTAEPMPRSLMPCGQPKLSSRQSAPAPSARLTISGQASRLDWAVADELDVVQTHHLCAVVVDRRVTRADVRDRLADSFPDGTAPAGIERAHNLLAAVGRRRGGEPEGIEAADTGEGSLEGGASGWH